MNPENTPDDKRRCDATLSVFSHIKSGLPPSRMWKENTLTEDQVKYALTALRRLNAIRKVGYGTWGALVENVPEKEGVKIHHVADTHTPQEGVRGHGYVATLKIPKIEGWARREGILGKAGIGFIGLKAQKAQRIRVDDIKKVWLCDRSVVFYLGKKSFFAENALKASWKAMDCLLDHVRKLESALQVGEPGFRIQGRYHIRFSRQHHGLVKNALAKQYDAEKKKLFVFDERGLWLLIDNSANLHELETVRCETTVDENIFVQKFFNELNETRITPMFIMHSIDQLVQDRAYYNRNLVSHVEAIKTLGSKTEAFSGAVDTFRQETLDLFTKMNKKLEALYNKMNKPAEAQKEDYEMVDVEFVMPNPEFHGIIGGMPHVYKARFFQMGQHVFLEKNTALALEKRKIVKLEGWGSI